MGEAGLSASFRDARVTSNAFGCPNRSILGHLRDLTEQNVILLGFLPIYKGSENRRDLSFHSLFHLIFGAERRHFRGVLGLKRGALEKMDYGFGRDLRRVATCHNEARLRGPYVKKRVKNRVNTDVFAFEGLSESLIPIR